MVAMGDFGCDERGRMVSLAVEHGLIQHAATQGERRGWTDTVVVVASAEAVRVRGAMGKLLSAPIGMLDAMPPRLRKIQKDAGCQPFVVFPVPLSVLVRMLDADVGDELRTFCETSDHAVLCLNNASNVISVCGVSRDTEGNQ